MQIPIKPSSGLLEDTKSYTSNPLPFLAENHKKFGDIFKFRLAHRHLIVINDADYIDHLLKTNQKNYIKSLAYRKLRKLLGNGLFTNEGESWLSQRRLAQPSFHKTQLDHYVHLIRQTTTLHLSNRARKESFPIQNLATDLTLDIISQTLFGQEETGKDLIRKELPKTLEFMIKRITTSVATPLWIPTAKNVAFKKRVNRLYKHIAKVIDKKRQQVTKDGSLLQQFIDAVDIDTGASMNNQQLKDEIMTFYLAGHETTAIAFSWMMYYLGQHQKALTHCIEEIQNIPDDYSFMDLHELRYVEATINETLRLCSPVWVLGREALSDDQLGPYKIKKGESIIFSPFILHRQTKHFSNPEQFNPDRFIHREHNPKAFIPFGSGPRQCIGNHFSIMELKIFLIELIRNGGFTVHTKDFPDYEHLLTLRPQKEISISLN